MKVKFILAAALGLAVAPCALMAQSTAATTGTCKDGTTTTATTKSGACKGHKGVATWTGATKGSTTTTAAPAAKAAPAATSTPAPAAKAAPAAAATSAPAPAAKAAPAASKASAKTAAPGGGPGVVWVNTSTKVYHCYGGQDYGTTKAGKYLSESDAKAQGFRPAAGKTCSK